MSSTQYYLTMSHGTGGSVRPTSGWRKSGASSSINATPANGYSFSGWTGTGSGSYPGPNNPASITRFSSPMIGEKELSASDHSRCPTVSTCVSIKYWEIIADKLSKARWSWCYVSAVDSSGRTIWIIDAHRGDGQRFIVHADEKLTAFVDLEAAIRYKYQNELFCPGRGIAKS